MQYKIGDKITLKEFFDSEEMLAIHCNTEEKANKLLKEFDKLGKVWRGGGKYIENNQYIKYNNSTCYTNEGGFATFDYYLNRNYKIYEFDDIIFEEQPKNLIPLIAKELGVEMGEEFEISNKVCEYKFTEDGLMGIQSNGTYNAIYTFLELITRKEKIIKLPKKPKLTEAEKVILENLPKKYKHIGRSKWELAVYDNDCDIGHPPYEALDVFEHLFQFIKEDKEPYKIQELLEEYENLRSE